MVAGICFFHVTRRGVCRGGGVGLIRAGFLSPFFVGAPLHRAPAYPPAGFSAAVCRSSSSTLPRLAALPRRCSFLPFAPAALRAPRFFFFPPVFRHATPFRQLPFGALSLPSLLRYGPALSTGPLVCPFSPSAFRCLLPVFSCPYSGTFLGLLSRPVVRGFFFAFCFTPLVAS